MKRIALFISLFNIGSLVSQGCSDAGFCSLANTMPLSAKTTAKNETLRLSTSVGKADGNIMVYNSALEYSRVVSKTIALHTRVSFLAHAGNSVQTGEIGDIFLTADAMIAPKWTSTFGFKVPFRNGDKVKKGVVLPMDYQPSLGTFDFLFAMKTTLDNWQLSLGTQIPLTQNNNTFFSKDFVAEEQFATTNRYFRNADLWLRLAYPFESKKWTMIPSLLPVYHLENDNYVDETGARRIIKGSKGLTLNAAAQIDYKINDDNTLGLNAAAPLVIRDARPDGLTRSFLFTLDFRHSF